jgi:hypothetical protein
MWILSLFTEIKFSLPQPPLLSCDNLGATNSILFSTHAWSTSKLTYTLFGTLFRKILLLFAMFTRMINLQTYLPNHFPGSTQIFSSTRSVSLMGARSCGGVSRKTTLPPHASYYCRFHDSIKENHTANSRELLLHDQLMQRQDSVNYYCMINSCNDRISYCKARISILYFPYYYS